VSLTLPRGRAGAAPNAVLLAPLPVIPRSMIWMDGIVLESGSSASLAMVDRVQLIVTSLLMAGDHALVHTTAAALALRSSTALNPGGVTCSEPTDDSLLDLYRA